MRHRPLFFVVPPWAHTGSLYPIDVTMRVRRFLQHEDRCLGVDLYQRDNRYASAARDARKDAAGTAGQIGGIHAGTLRPTQNQGPSRMYHSKRLGSEQLY